MGVGRADGFAGRNCVKRPLPSERWKISLLPLSPFHENSNCESSRTDIQRFPRSRGYYILRAYSSSPPPSRSGYNFDGKVGEEIREEKRVRTADSSSVITIRHCTIRLLFLPTIRIPVLPGLLSFPLSFSIYQFIIFQENFIRQFLLVSSIASRTKIDIFRKRERERRH